MSLIIAYLTVILIWSTTPLGIVWSSASVAPSLAFVLRMVIALIIGLMWLKIANIRFPWHKHAIKLYAYSGIGIGGGMFSTYLAAKHVPSGLISLIFGLSPILASLFAQKILAEEKFSLIKKIALTIAIIGLAIVCFDKINLAEAHYWAIALVFLAVSLFAISAVLVKSVTINIHPLATTMGTIIILIPWFICVLLFQTEQLTFDNWQPRAIWSIIYLGVFGSLIGFVAYFYCLKHLSASTVSLITLLTPIIAICLGYFFNNETINEHLIVGAGFILFGLFLFLFGHRLVNTMKIIKIKYCN